MTTGPDGRAPGARPLGARLASGGVGVRVWAPGHAGVALVTPDGGSLPLDDEGDGHFAGLAEGLGTGSLYGFRLSGEDLMRPDPASRFQPEGPDGWSQVVDPAAFAWTDGAWAGVTLRGQVIYEMHVGTLTPEGTWAAAAGQLERLRDLGVTLVELMPVGEWAGQFGWGYDGVGLFAPFHHYGPPDAMRRFVDRAHALGLGVILDVVYNHLGPEANHVPAFAPSFLSEVHKTDWGQQPNYDRAGSEGVRAFVLANVAQWIGDYHLDGLRIDATQNILDESPEHILTALVRTARAAAAPRSVVIVAENEPQDERLLRPPEEGGHGMDAVWADDVHHSAFVALTGRAGAYQADYAGSPQELLSAFRRGYLFQGQRSGVAGGGRGTAALGVAPRRFVAYLENHDQVANTSPGLRLHQRAGPGRLRAVTALLLLGPTTPMLFQGQETGSEAPFNYFLDVGEALHASVREGRMADMGRFPNLAASEMRDQIPDPTLESTFLACKLRSPGPGREARMVALHRDLLRLRREDPTIRLQGEGGLEGAVIGPEAFLLRFLGPAGEDRLLLVNLGRDLESATLAEPLLAPPALGPWAILWSSEHPDYGGTGTPPVVDEQGRLFVAGHSAVLLGPTP